MTIKDLPLDQKIKHIKNLMECVSDWEEICDAMESSYIPSGEQSIYWYKAWGIVEALMVQCDDAYNELKDFVDKFQEVNASTDWKHPKWNNKDLLLVLLAALGSDKELFDAFSRELG